MPRLSLLALSTLPLAAGFAILTLADEASAQGNATTKARVEKRGARLLWARGVGAESCVGLAGLEEDVKRRLGYDPFALAPSLTIEGTIVRALPTGFRAGLVIRSADGKTLGARELASRDPDCRSLGEAVAVATTVAIDPDAPGTPQETGVVLEPPAEPAPPPLAPPPAAREPRGLAILSGGASVGLVPEIGPLVSLRVLGRLSPAFELGVGLHVLPETRTRGLGFGLASASLDACVAPFASARVLRWCAAIHGGLFQVFVHAAELAPVEVGMFPWAGVETGPSLVVPIAGAMRLELRVSAWAPIVRRQALVRGTAEPVWEQSPVAGSAELGLGASF